jgi:hypothetical protein
VHLTGSIPRHRHRHTSGISAASTAQRLHSECSAGGAAGENIRTSAGIQCPDSVGNAAGDSTEVSKGGQSHGTGGYSTVIRPISHPAPLQFLICWSPYRLLLISTVKYMEAEGSFDYLAGCGITRSMKMAFIVVTVFLCMFSCLPQTGAMTFADHGI